MSTGFVSPVIAGLVLDGNIKDASFVANNIRVRQDGRNRSPWNEPECNMLYSRAMAHWNIFDQVRRRCEGGERGVERGGGVTETQAQAETQAQT